MPAATFASITRIEPVRLLRTANIRPARRRLMPRLQIKRPGEQLGQAASRERDVGPPDPQASIRQNPVLFAIAADAARYNYWIPGNRTMFTANFGTYLVLAACTDRPRRDDILHEGDRRADCVGDAQSPDTNAQDTHRMSARESAEAVDFVPASA
jgi:hypothetical protein